MSKVLYLSYDGLSDPLGQSQIIPYLNGFKRNNYDITIISFEKNYNQHNDILRNELEAGIVWIPLKYHKFPPILSTIYDLIYLYFVSRKIIQNESIKILHCRSYLTSLVGQLLKKKYGLKFIFDMRGFWPDERVEGNIWNLKNPFYRLIYAFFKRKEIRFLENADIVTSLTNNSIKELLVLLKDNNKKEILKSKIVVIPTCVDTDLFNPEAFIQNPPNINFEMSDYKNNPFVLGYVGSLGTWYMIDEMLDFYRLLLIKKPNAVFLIITKDIEQLFTTLRFRGWMSKTTIREYLKPHNKDKSRKIDIQIDTRTSGIIEIMSVTRNQVPICLNKITATICLIKPTFSKKASFATKIGESLAMNVPVITNPDWGDINEIIIQGKNGCLLKKINTDSVTEAINEIEMINGSQNLTVRKTVLTRMSLKFGLEQYLKIYNQLSN